MIHSRVIKIVMNDKQIKCDYSYNSRRVSCYTSDIVEYTWKFHPHWLTPKHDNCDNHNHNDDDDDDNDNHNDNGNDDDDDDDDDNDNDLIQSKFNIQAFIPLTA